MDADTRIPYCVLGKPPPDDNPARYFNLVICHDLFDSYERMKIMIAPVLARYPGAQVTYVHILIDCMACPSSSPSASECPRSRFHLHMSVLL